MGTKRPFDEDLQEFMKHPKHLECWNKPDSFGEDKIPLETSPNVGIAGEGGAKFFHLGDGMKSENVIAVPDMVDKEFETSAPLPLVTGISDGEEDAGPGPVFCPTLFPELFEFNLPRRQLVHYDDTYSSLLNCSPRKEVPVGPEHQVDVPEFDSEIARNYCIKYGNVSDNGRGESLMGIFIIPLSNSSFSNQEGETVNVQLDCKCLDGGSIRCVQQHVSEARLKLRESLGHEKFVDLGFNDMGEEVACNWTEEEEQLFHDVVYSNPVSHGKRFWEQLSIAFPSRTKKELVSYYFNVFMLRRRAVQNRSKLLEIDSDDDEWWGSKKRPSGISIEDECFVVVGSSIGHGDHDSSSEDGDDSGGGEGDIVIGVTEGSCTSFENQHSAPNKNQIDERSSTIICDEKFTSENEQEKPLNMNKQESNNGGVRSESYLHWDPPYSTMGPTKGVDLLPTCSMIEEIFGSSKNGEST